MIPIRRAAIRMKVCSSIQDIHTFDECAHAWTRPLGDCAVHHQHHPIIQHTISEFLLDQRDSALLCWCWLEPDSDCGAAEHAPWSHQGRHLGGRPSSSYEYEVQKYLSRRENIDIILQFCWLKWENACDMICLVTPLRVVRAGGPGLSEQ